MIHSPMTDAFEMLLSKDAIRDVLMDLARGTDRLDAELIRSCYHPDAQDDHNAFRGGPAEFADWVLANLPHFAATMHFLGNIRIDVSGDVAWSETYCVAHHLFRPDDPDGERDLVLGLRYFDRFERREGGGPIGKTGWKIALRRCVFDWSYTVPIAEKWPFAEHYTTGRRDRGDPTYRRESGKRSSARSEVKPSGDRKASRPARSEVKPSGDRKASRPARSEVKPSGDRKASRPARSEVKPSGDRTKSR